MFEGGRWPLWRLALVGLSLLALALSSYLAWHSVTGGAVLGCVPGNGCDQVMSSRWSSIGGFLPVSGLAAGLYLAMVVASMFVGSDSDEPTRRMAWQAMLFLMGAAAGSAVWFIYAQKVLVGAFCPYCMATHVTGLTLAALVFWQARRQAVLKAALPLAGAAAAGIVAVCQFVIVPAPQFRAGVTADALPLFDPHDAPRIGPPSAPYTVEILFDYRCPHCQHLHFMLDDVVRTYRGKLCFALCPTPLEPRCNPYVPMEVPEFRGSCDLARLALAVWFADKRAFPAFDQWMFSFESGGSWQPRSLVAARAKAFDLVGKAKLSAAEADPRVDRYLSDCVGLYGRTARSGVSAVPKLMFGSRWVVPQPDTPEQLLSILEGQLGLPKP